MIPWHYVLLVVVGFFVMLGCAFLALAVYLVLDIPPRCPSCDERLPAYYRGARYAGERCPACTVAAAVESTR